jgi:hypothetical protein
MYDWAATEVPPPVEILMNPSSPPAPEPLIPRISYLPVVVVRAGLVEPLNKPPLNRRPAAVVNEPKLTFPATDKPPAVTMEPLPRLLLSVVFVTVKTPVNEDAFPKIFPPMKIEPPRLMSPPIPTPPAVTREPVTFEIEDVASEMSTLPLSMDIAYPLSVIVTPVPAIGGPAICNVAAAGTLVGVAEVIVACPNLTVE